MITPRTDTRSASAPEAWAILAGELQQLQLALASFAEAASGMTRDQLSVRVQQRFQELLRVANALIGARSALTPEARAAVGQRLQDALLPFLTRCELGARMYEKPRGYAGDFYTIELMYRGASDSDGPVESLIGRCMMGTAAFRAVRNRRTLLRSELSRTLTEVPSRAARITSLACGPARELFDCMDLVGADRMDLTLVDIDPQALDFVRAQAEARGVIQRVRLERQNLIALAMGERELAQAPQDLIYSIGLIDYLKDAQVVGLLDWVHGQLAPGGRVILGNFHPDNTTRVIMDHVLEWRLIHRDEDDMDRLFRASRFGRASTALRFEDAGVNLFAECVKAQ